MKLFKNLLPIVALVVNLEVFAVPAVAPDNRIRIWEGSALSFPDSQYTFGNTTAMGTIKTLKSNSTVINLLTTYNAASNTGGLDMSAKFLSARQFNSGSHQRLSENSIPSGECVAFAKAMTGAPGTTKWFPGKKMMDYITWNGAGYILNPLTIPLRSGTMIAHFRGLNYYPQGIPYGHVAIFLSWSYNAQGYIDGVNVIDQNLVWSVGGNTGSAAGLIQKHKLPLFCSAGSSCGSSTYSVTFYSSNYHVVDVR